MPFSSNNNGSHSDMLVTILRTGDPGLLSIAKSLLADAGIESLAKGEGVQYLFGLGRIGAGYNVITGPVELQVMRKDEEAAIETLEELLESDEAETESIRETGCDGYASPEGLNRIRSAWWRRLIFIVPSVLVGTLVLIAFLGENGNKPVVRDLSPLPPTSFDSQVAMAFYGKIWMFEGGSKDHFPEVHSTRVVVDEDSVFVEEWKVSRADGYAYYPVYQFARPDSSWILGVGQPHETMLTDSVVVELRKNVSAD